MLTLNSKRKTLYSIIFLLIVFTPFNSLTLPNSSTLHSSHGNKSITSSVPTSNNENTAKISASKDLQASTNSRTTTTTTKSSSAKLTTATSSSSGSLQTQQVQNKQSLSNVTSTSDYTMGSVRSFWVENLRNAQNTKFLQGDWAYAMYKINATLVNISAHAYFYVESNITSQYTSNGFIQHIAQTFETKINPADEQLGIPLNIGQYNQNGKIIILLFPFIQISTTSTVVGYFWPLHMHKPSTDPTSIYYYSNYAQMIQLDSNSVTPTSDWEPTLAHEYFHLIHYNYNPNENVWLEEGLAVFAEYHAGYSSGYGYYLQDSQGNGYFLHANDLSLTYFTETLQNYGSSFLFVLYFYQLYGLSFIRDIVQFKNISGLAAFKYELSQKEPNVSFNSLYNNWVIANTINVQSNPTYSYRNFTYKVSQSQYNVGKTFQIIPSQFTVQQLPYWSNQYYTLPTNNNQPYLITFQPELQNVNSTFQVTVLTSENGIWSIQKIPLVNSQSGSFIVKYDSSSQSKYLIISSLDGTTSGYSPITSNQLLKTYFSTYNIYLEPFSYSVDYNKESYSNQNYPTYNFSIYSSTGEIVPQNTVASITMNVYRWNTTNALSGLPQNIYFSQANQTWMTNATNFQSLPWGQYYFTLTVKLTTGQTFTDRGLTFLVGNPNLSSGSTSTNNKFSFPLPFISPELLFTVLVIIPLVRLRKRKK